MKIVIATLIMASSSVFAQQMRIPQVQQIPFEVFQGMSPAEKREIILFDKAIQDNRTLQNIRNQQAQSLQYQQEALEEQQQHYRNVEKQNQELINQQRLQTQPEPIIINQSGGGSPGPTMSDEDLAGFKRRHDEMWARWDKIQRQYYGIPEPTQEINRPKYRPEVQPNRINNILKQRAKELGYL